MDLLTTTLIAVGLAMDAFAVSIGSGFCIKRVEAYHAFKIAFFFGAFQAIMPVIGWLAGLTFRSLLSQIDHWIAFVLLLFIGGKMIYESRQEHQDKKMLNPMKLAILLMLSVATSIDALAVGITFAFLNITIATPIAIIGTVTFFLSFGGVYIGNRLGHFFERKIETLGGLILIGIGIRILVQHLMGDSTFPG